MIKNVLLILFVSLIQADKVEFKNGAVLNGKVTKQNTSTLSIDVGGTVTTYSKSDIKNTTLDAVVALPPPPPPHVAATTKASLIVQAGIELHAKTITALSTSQHKQGYQFQMVLENDLLTRNGVVVAPKGSNIYGSVIKSTQAGRLVGKSEMIISLNAISINNKRINITTNSINILTGKKQASDTVNKMVRGAAIGALFNGHDGAHDGAKVGLGAAILTRGKSTGVAAGNLVKFTLVSGFEVD